jgi:hypothetical protein
MLWGKGRGMKDKTGVKDMTRAEDMKNAVRKEEKE